MSVGVAAPLALRRHVDADARAPRDLLDAVPAIFDVELVSRADRCPFFQRNAHRVRHVAGPPAQRVIGNRRRLLVPRPYATACGAGASTQCPRAARARESARRRAIARARSRRSRGDARRSSDTRTRARVGRTSARCVWSGPERRGRRDRIRRHTPRLRR